MDTSTLIFNKKRTHACGSLRAEHKDLPVTIMGWVDSRRDHGNLVFIDLRDVYGTVQVVLDPNQSSMQNAKDLGREFVVAIEGRVVLRPAGMENKKINTGQIEVVGSSCQILNTSQVPPFLTDDANVTETTRLKYRYLDLRSPRLQRHLVLRHELLQNVREFFTSEGFFEIETPILYKSTPEGARDYLVPSRVNPGQFYALPQSPQTLKQLLMIAGFDRYFQIARCFRDEDLRADRQPEFTQIDIEMSFVDQEDIMNLNEKLAKRIWKKFLNFDLPKIPRMTYQEAMDLYGSDKPDLRFDLTIQDLTALVKNSGFRVFEDTLLRNGYVRGIRLPNGASLSRSAIDKLTELVKQAGGKGLIWLKKPQDGGELSCSAQKFLSATTLSRMAEELGLQEGDMGFIVADDFNPLCAQLNALRLQFAKDFNLIQDGDYKFLWVTDFPLLEYAPLEKRYVACHHPFTSPSDDSLPALLNQESDKLGNLKAKAYDLVCNGYEIAGGSIRIFRSEVQAAMFKVLGMSEEETQIKFGYFLDALKYGTPPHGGIAWGMDRLSMIITGTEAIREVIAFPKTARASCLMSEAPSSVDTHQLIELGIRLNK